MNGSRELRQGLMDADHGAEEAAAPPAAAADVADEETASVASGASTDATSAAERSTLSSEAGDGTPAADAAESGATQPPPGPERSMLSRAGSIGELVTLTANRRRAPPPARSRLVSFCPKTSAWFTATLLLGILAAVGLVGFAFTPPSDTGQPKGRTGAAMAVLPAAEAGSGGGNASAGQRVLLWSGRGQSGSMYRGVYLFSLAELSWKKGKERADPAPQQSVETAGPFEMPAAPEQQQQQQLRQQTWQPSEQQHAQRMPAWRRMAASWLPRRPPRPPPPPPLPDARWKAAVATVEGLGMVVHGGSTPGSSKGQGTGRNDTWLLSLPGLRWQQGCVCDGSGTKCVPACEGGADIPAPSARRSHTLVGYQDEAGQGMLLLFGGRREDGLLLNDVWRGTILSPKGNGSCQFAVSWELLHDPQAGVGTGPAPLPRRGHVAVMQNSSRMILHGGRSEVYGSFADVWAFTLATNRWEPLTPAKAVQPAARDYHGAALWNGRLLIFGGRYGTLAEATRPIGDRWLFDLEARLWWQLPIRGLSPLPRFMFASRQFTPEGGGPDQFLVFGGETGNGCKCADMFSMDLETNRWTQLSTARFETTDCQRQFG